MLAVYEYAMPFYAGAMRDWSVERRLDTAVQLADLAVYLQRSPVGSLRVADFKESHFLLLDAGRRIVMTDLDDVTSAEPACHAHRRTDDVSSTSCLYGLQVLPTCTTIMIIILALLLLLVGQKLIIITTNLAFGKPKLQEQVTKYIYC